MKNYPALHPTTNKSGRNGIPDADGRPYIRASFARNSESPPLPLLDKQRRQPDAASHNSSTTDGETPNTPLRTGCSDSSAFPKENNKDFTKSPNPSASSAPVGARALNIRPQTRRLTQLALLGALALVISGLELMIPPLPMLPPGAKPGLSNIVTMYASSSVGLVPALGIALLKGIFAGVTRGFTAFLMSTLGGLLSTLVMGLLLKCKAKPFGLVGVGIAGAVTHNAAQLGVAALLTTPSVVAYAPVLLIFSLVTGTVTGFVLRAALPALKRL